MQDKKTFDMLYKILDELIDEAERESITWDNIGYPTDDADAKVMFYTALKHKLIKQERHCVRHCRA